MTEPTNVDPLETRGRSPVRKSQTPPMGRDLARLSLMKFPSQISVAQWDDWQWQVRNQITTAQELERWVPLSVEEKRAIQFSQGRFKFSLTPYWASLIEAGNFHCPIRRQAIPLDEEFRTTYYHPADFNFQPIQIANGRLIHSYRDRATISVHSRCVVYCRYCPQRKIADKTENVAGGTGATMDDAEWRDVILYIKNHPEIREVIISGGEPLLLNDDFLSKAFLELRSVSSVKILRLETRIVSVLPQRVTSSLIRLLKDFQPLYLILSVNHPREITEEFSNACTRLVDSGIPLASESVLLREVNDRPQILSELFLSLFKLRVRPYRIVQCMPSQGTDHFRTSISSGLRLMQFLRASLPGLAIPEYVVDTAEGKIPLRYESILSRNKKRVLLKSNEGKIFVYPEKIFSFSC